MAFRKDLSFFRPEFYEADEADLHKLVGLCTSILVPAAAKLPPVEGKSVQDFLSDILVKLASETDKVKIQVVTGRLLQLTDYWDTHHDKDKLFLPSQNKIVLDKLQKIDEVFSKAVKQEKSGQKTGVHKRTKKADDQGAHEHDKPSATRITKK